MSSSPKPPHKHKWPNKSKRSRPNNTAYVVVKLHVSRHIYASDWLHVAQWWLLAFGHPQLVSSTDSRFVSSCFTDCSSRIFQIWLVHDLPPSSLSDSLMRLLPPHCNQAESTLALFIFQHVVFAHGMCPKKCLCTCPPVYHFFDSNKERAPYLTLAFFPFQVSRLRRICHSLTISVHIYRRSSLICSGRLDARPNARTSSLIQYS